MTTQIPGIVFSSSEVSTVIRILSNNIHLLKSLKTFRISSSKNSIALFLLDDDESLTFLKLFFSSLENYTLEKEKSFLDESDIMPLLTTPEEDTTSQVDTSSDIGNREIRNYVLTLKTFTRKDLKRHFPNAKDSSINNGIRSLKNRNLISTIGWGEFSVNK